MTTFVVSLFLPKTIDFEKSKTSTPVFASSSTEDAGSAVINGSAVPVPADLGDSLLADNIPQQITLPKTPATMAVHEDYFTPTQPSATHFLRPEDPKTLVRSDAHVPEWGASGLFNQPRSMADPAPPDTIPQYTQAQERAQQKREGRPSFVSTTSSKDTRWQQPYKIVTAVQGNGGLTNAVRSAERAEVVRDLTFVGLVGFPTDALDESKKSEIYDKLAEEFQALTVFVSDKDYDGHYAHYCKTILWPVFHYVIPDHPKSKAFHDHSWVFYESVNQAIADKVVKNYKRGDTIWIHDYHLLLVPSMIRQKLPDAKIGFFLHTAFPSSEVFRCLAARKELLEGMLGSNLVGFQTPEYAHHFPQTCSRILAVEAVDDGVQLETRFVNVFSSPIGIDPQDFSDARDTEEVREAMKAMEERYKGKRVIVARDKLDSIRGVRQKLLAFELFLKKYPEWKDKVVLIQVASSTQEDAELASTVSEIVTRIDAQHSTLTHNPLVFLRQDIAFHQYLALLSIADALVITSLREGMNLNCHEFIICQDGKYGSKKHGPLILSEFTGSASIFEGAELAVNPWDYSGIAKSFATALEMTPSEKKTRYHKMAAKVNHSTGAFWVESLSEQLNKVFEEQFSRDTMSIPRLSTQTLIKDYEASGKRIFFLDYEGTLASYGSVNSTVVTNVDKIIDILSDLLTDSRNLIYVTSGRTVEELELLFNRLPGLGLIAENGCFVKECGGGEWVQFLDPEKTNQWKDAIKRILQYYVERVEGSWVEERKCSLIFHYEAGEADSNTRQAGECANHINDASEQQRVKAVPSKDSVIIEPSDFDKSTAAQHILSRMPEGNLPEFMLVAGNDRDDETIFKWGKTLKDNSSVRNVHTVTVGDRNSVAMSTLPNGTTGLLNVLVKLAKTAAKK